MVRGIRLITLDATGTIFKFREPPPITYSRIAGKHGAEFDSEAISKSFKKSYVAVNQKWPHFGSVSGVSSETWWKEVVFHTFATQYDKRRVEDISEELYLYFSSKSAYLIYPDFLRFLEEWQGKAQMLVISNFDKRLHQVLQEMDLMQFFEQVITSEEAKVSKPHPDIFKYALHKSSVKPQPHNILHIGDDQENDLNGAKSVGWNSLLLNRQNAASRTIFDSVVSFDEVSQKIKKNY